VLVVCRVGICLCDELITRREESRRRSRPQLDCGATQGDDEIKEDSIGWACGTQREKSMQGFVGEI